MRSSDSSRVLLVACILFAACATRRDAIYIAPELTQTRIDTIAVAPIIDARADAFEDVQVLAQVRRTVENALSERGYAVLPARLTRNGERYSTAEIAKMSDAELASAARGDAPHVLVVSLESIERGAGELGETIRVKLSGRLIDTVERRELWRDMAEGDADLSGLLTLLTGPAPDYEAAYDAARALFSTLPEGPHRGRGPIASPQEHAPVETLRPAQGR